ncbi:MAG: trypsin-like serine peptidase [Gammaproteobacteria bacterium]
MLIALQSSAYADDDYLTRSFEEVKSGSAIRLESASSDSYWTPGRLKNAKPRTPRVTVDKILNLKMSTKSDALVNSKTGIAEATNASRPAVRAEPDLENRLFVPETENQKSRARTGDVKRETPQTAVRPQSVRTQHAHFTSSRLIPLSADLQYPYRAVGRLFYTQPGVGNFVCSAAVIEPRIILTAGHCVHSGSGGANGFYANFAFVPAFRDGASPFQVWNGVYGIVTATWGNGGGRVPNAADYALIELQDRPFAGAVRRIGMVTGSLGVKTRSLHPNHAHLLGYPVNLDRGMKMHQVTAQRYGSGGINTIIYGSDMGPGSSGGPWVQNFQSRAAGQTGGGNPGSNRVIGVTSYGAVSMGPRYEGSSILDARFTEILSFMCARRPANC